MTKPKYEEMSDLDINKMVAAKLGINFPVKPKEPYCSIDGNVIRNNGTDGKDGRPYFGDYCNNPSDAWPIIVENKIDITSPASIGADDWQARKFYIQFSKDNIYSLDKNPLRAAMICFLRTKDAENENN